MMGGDPGGCRLVRGSSGDPETGLSWTVLSCGSPWSLGFLPVWRLGSKGKRPEGKWVMGSGTQEPDRSSRAPGDPASGVMHCDLCCIGQSTCQTTARAALQRRDWDVAYQKFWLANEELKYDGKSAAFCKECEESMAIAKYEAAKQALRESNRELAAQYAEEALKLRHPHAGALLDGLKAEQKQEAETDITEIQHRRNDPDYKKDRDIIRKRLRLSSQYLAVADLNSALEQCDLVLRSDPYNQQAIALRDRIQRKRQMIIDKEREATRKGMIADVGAAWRPVPRWWPPLWQASAFPIS